MTSSFVCRVPDGGSFGWVDLPEFPFSVEPRQITRWEARRWAREAFNLGVRYIVILIVIAIIIGIIIVRYIGGCCGFEPYHVR